MTRKNFKGQFVRISSPSRYHSLTKGDSTERKEVKRFFVTFLECSLPIFVSITAIKKYVTVFVKEI